MVLSELSFVFRGWMDAVMNMPHVAPLGQAIGNKLRT